MARILYICPYNTRGSREKTQDDRNAGIIGVNDSRMFPYDDNAAKGLKLKEPSVAGAVQPCRP